MSGACHREYFMSPTDRGNSLKSLYIYVLTILLLVSTFSKKIQEFIPCYIQQYK